jgi:hypothetical protein
LKVSSGKRLARLSSVQPVVAGQTSIKPCLGFRVWGLGFRVCCLGFGSNVQLVDDSGFRVDCLGLRVVEIGVLQVSGLAYLFEPSICLDDARHALVFEALAKALNPKP